MHGLVKIEDMIYEIRGKQVMLDSDLAKLYHCKNGTKEINQAVKNNPEKFPERFSWKLTDGESDNLRSKFLTSSSNTNYGGRRYVIRVFTEQGVAMLATILHTDVATKVSIKIMDAFVAMRHYIGNNEYRLSNIESKIINYDNRLCLIENTFKQFEEKKKINEIYFNGQIYDAYSKILDILKEAEKEIIIIDSYADREVLDIIKKLAVKVTIITNKNNLLTKQMIGRYNKQYHNLEVIWDNIFHDRYFIIDKNIVYHCGTSINRIGYKTFSINLINDEEVIDTLIKKISLLCN
ncbi:MAG: ORF6N domain-containing protein [Bacilli bacterium]|nr:ORF6N domain-containing protein [Bacilli bacterium]